MSERVNRSELARRLNITEGAVRKHIKRGVYRAGSDGLIDFENAKAAIAASRDPDAAIKGVLGAQARVKDPDAGGPVLPDNSLTRARAAAAVMQAKRQQLALEKEKGELIKTEDAYKACRAVISIVLERLDGAAAQIGPRVVGLEAAAAERVAREVLHTVRGEIAGMTSAIQELADAKS